MASNDTCLFLVFTPVSTSFLLPFFGDPKTARSRPRQLSGRTPSYVLGNLVKRCCVKVVVAVAVMFRHKHRGRTGNEAKKNK